MKHNNKDCKGVSRNVMRYLHTDNNACCWDYSFLIGLIHAKLSDMYNYWKDIDKRDCYPENHNRIKNHIYKIKRLFEIYINSEDLLTKQSHYLNLRKYIDLQTSYNAVLECIAKQKEKEIEQLDFSKQSTLSLDDWELMELNDLYRIKAMRIAFKLLGECCEEWWD